MRISPVIRKIDAEIKALRERKAKLNGNQLEVITQLVSEKIGIDPELLTAPGREQRRVDARSIVYYIARKHTRETIIRMGEFFNRDHGTVSHGIGLANALLATDRKFAAILTEVEKEYLSLC